jgi:hypothetical protein
MRPDQREADLYLEWRMTMKDELLELARWLDEYQSVHYRNYHAKFFGLCYLLDYPQQYDRHPLSYDAAAFLRGHIERDLLGATASYLFLPGDTKARAEYIRTLVDDYL